MNNLNKWIPLINNETTHEIFHDGINCIVRFSNDKIRNHPHAGIQIMKWKNKICKTPIDGGYKKIFAIDEKGTKRNIHLHRLIAYHFIPNPNNHPVINHIDGDKLNYQIDNLEWCTVKHNTNHAWDNNLCVLRRTLSFKEAEEIRAKRKLKISRKSLALEYNTSIHIIKNILCNRNYRSEFRNQ